MQIFSSMLGLLKEEMQSWFSKIIDIITGFFAVIPQFIYFIYTSCASFLDLLQYLIRKLAGLDFYYVNGKPKAGDIVTEFIKGILGINKSENYSALSTVFWSLVIFGCILLVLTTIFSIIKAHYNYDSKKSNPLTIIGSSLKTLSLMAIVPIVSIFGLYLSQILLQALDEITTSSSISTSSFEGNALSESFESGYYGPVEVDQEGNVVPKTDSQYKVYSSYDFFGSIAYTNTTTFSGVMFKTASYNCNRVRTGLYSVPTSQDFSKWDNFGIFYTSKAGDEGKNSVANQIDYAFANALTLKDSYVQSIGIVAALESGKIKDVGEEEAVLISSYTYAYSALTALGLKNVSSFSKFNVGLVFYYYNLWGFNFLLAFAGIIAFLTLLGNIVFGLITRLVQLLALFFIFPPLIGISPLDEGKGFKAWRKSFIENILMVFGAIVGINIFFLILPFLNSISFFNDIILDSIMNIIIMLAGLTMVKKLIEMISSYIGGGDANKTGGDVRKDTGELGMKAVNTTLKAANLGVKVGGGAASLYGGVVGALGGRKVMEGIGKAKNYMSKDSRDKRFYDKHVRPDTTGSLNDYIARGQTKEDFENHYRSPGNALDKRINRQATTASIVKATEKVLKRGTVFATVPLGAKIQRDSSGKIDDDATLKGFGTGVVDITGLTFKLGPGAILGGASVYKKLDEGKVIDSGRTALSTFFNGVAPNSSFAKGMKTAKNKEDEEKAEVSQERKNMSETNENTKKVLQAMIELNNKIH